METAALYEVISQVDNEQTRTVTDAAGVAELVHQAAAAGTRVHVRPLGESTD